MKKNDLNDMKVASATECTGLTPTPPSDESEAQSDAELYQVHPQKPDKACRKGKKQELH